MLKKHSSEFSVFGNPINHTKSPYIHWLFSKQTGVFHSYDYTLVPLDKFRKFIVHFFLFQGIGANVTVPFKEEAFLISDELTDHAKSSKSVNTLKKLSNGRILGDNTDGKGILYDLQRLKFINKTDNVLVIGAGGAARGVIFSLLSYGCNVFVVNRTINRAIKLVNDFKKFGSIFIVSRKNIKYSSFHLIINATSNTQMNSYWNSIIHLIDRKAYFYDINYSDNTHTHFLSWCINFGALMFSDGLGMLVSQAAYSFYLWHGIFPEIDSVIFQLRKR
ncbi:MAG: shikimate dehydrogenase [Buchnera aphidicola (Kaburagia rhusicola ensigallis)]